MKRPARLPVIAAVCMCALACASASGADSIQVSETDEQIKIETHELEAVIRKQGYVSGVAGGSFLDKQTGFRDAGFGLDIVDWIIESGSDESYRDKLPREMVYEFNNSYHGRIAKRLVEGPQICTQARQLSPAVIRGKDFVAVQMDYKYHQAPPGKQAGSVWRQTLVFPAGKRYFLSCDKITSANDGQASCLRLDMPGHIKHAGGDTFNEIYLSYHPDLLPASEFQSDFAPDEKFRYVRSDKEPPKRFIRAYHLRDPQTGKSGPWLAGMTLDPAIVADAWCHQRGYVCMIEEFGGRPIRAGESFSAAFVVGYFDTIDEMHAVYDQYAGSSGLEVSEGGWKFVREAKRE